MIKQELIKLVKTEFAPEKINVAIFGNDVGCNQFRELATLCKKAECCDEIEILIEYNMAKDNFCSSWRANNNGVTFGDTVLKCIKTVKQNDKDQDEKVILYDLSMFFGYLYRYARIQKECNVGNKKPFNNKRN